MSDDISRKKFLLSSRDSSPPKFDNPLFEKFVSNTWRKSFSSYESEGLTSNLDSQDASVLRDVTILPRDIHINSPGKPRSEGSNVVLKGHEKRLPVGYLYFSTNLGGSMGYDAAMIKKWIDETSQYAHIKPSEGETENKSPCDESDTSLFPDEIEKPKFYNIESRKFEPATKDFENTQWGFVKRTKDSVIRQDYHQGKLPIMLVRFEAPYFPQSRKSRMRSFCRDKKHKNNSFTAIPTSNSVAR